MHDANGCEYAAMTHDEATENHSSGENSKPSGLKEKQGSIALEQKMMPLPV